MFQHKLVKEKVRLYKKRKYLSVSTQISERKSRIIQGKEVFECFNTN